MAAETINVPPGMTQMWDPKAKQVILVSAPPAGPDVLVLTVRLHDPRERQNAKKSAWWGTVKIPRADSKLSASDLATKHLVPIVEEIQKALNG
jgi:hypothetical protein